MPRRNDLKPTAHPGIWTTAGGHVFRVRARDPRTGKESQPYRFVRGNLAAALREQAKVAGEVRTLGRVKRTRLAGYAASWLARKAGGLSIGTLARYTSSLDDHILPVLGERYIDMLSPEDVLAWRDAAAQKTWTARERDAEGNLVLVQRPYGPRTVNGWLRVLRTVLADACAELRLGTSPASRAAALLEPETYTDEDPNLLSPEDLGALLVSLRAVAPAFYPLLCFMGFTGCRPSEATGLKWADISDDVALLRRSAVRGHVRERTKTKKERRIPLAPPVLDLLTAQREKLSEEARRLSARRGEVVAISEWVFPSDVGTPRYATTLAKPLRAALKDAGITTRLTPSGLRRTLNDVLRLVATADVQKAITGHSTEAMREHYSHVGVEERKRAIGRVADVVRLERRRA